LCKLAFLDCVILGIAKVIVNNKHSKECFSISLMIKIFLVNNYNFLINPFLIFVEKVVIL